MTIQLIRITGVRSFYDVSQAVKNVYKDAHIKVVSTEIGDFPNTMIITYNKLCWDEQDTLLYIDLIRRKIIKTCVHHSYSDELEG